ncbi:MULTISPECIES: RNA polymerase sporulation sigma factor SigG [unclassified Sporosarcina]|uniref:RNA polymerase sporulation sigma factor SigG n=1 Tax=unclassified Sporosarcina TaxID=2647733 RepID=UPI00057A74A6|nr:RNA polymerase sporulation sigma factor SigG [Sporosarcina sp. ZBG7A]VDG97419.1 Stage II sporulation protein AC [Lysinibacillus sphaericus]
MVRTRVEICGIDTSTLPLLTSDVMKETFIRLQSGDESARDELVTANLRLVLSLVQRFAYRGEQADDLFQVGCVGLLKSIDNFDLKHNVRFSTYAVPMIVGEIKRHLRDHHSVRVSRSLRDIAYKAIRAKEEFINEHQKEPRISDLAKMTDIPEEDILFALDAIQDPMSLHEPMNGEGGDPVYMMDQLHDKTVSEERWSTYVSMKETMTGLDDRQQLILSKRFYLGQTQTEIARELGISQAQISRLEKQAIAQIREGMEQSN